MNALLHRHCAKYIYVLPDGLRELMSDISREVLRSHPTHTYTFIADYLDALMITRENARVAARLVDCITEIGITIVELLTRTGITREDADKAAAIIQVAFRRHLDLKREFQVKQFNMSKEEEEEYFTNQIIQQCGISYEKAEEATLIIQEAYRRFRQHEKLEHDLLLGMVDWRVAARSAIYLYRKTGVSMYEANRAATLIKAAYKGYYTRQVMRRLVEEGHLAFDMEVQKDVESTLGEGDVVSKTATDDFLNDTPQDLDVARGVMEILLHAVVMDDQSFEGADKECSQELLNVALITGDKIEIAEMNDENVEERQINGIAQENVEEATDVAGEPTDVVGEPTDVAGEPMDVAGEATDVAVEATYVAENVYDDRMEDNRGASIIAGDENVGERKISGIAQEDVGEATDIETATVIEKATDVAEEAMYVAEGVYDDRTEDNIGTTIIAGDENVEEREIIGIAQEDVEKATDVAEEATYVAENVYDDRTEDNIGTSIIAGGTDTETTENIGFTETTTTEGPTTEGPTTEETTE